MGVSMTREEFAKIVKGLNVVYASDNFISDQSAFDIWYYCLSDLSYQQLSMAAQKYMQTNHFPPKPADLREIVVEIETPVQDYGEAWQEVQTAIRRYGYMREADALASLSPITRKVVEQLGWNTICMAQEGDQTQRANFRMIYQNLEHRAKEAAQLSPQLRDAIAERRVNALQIEAEQGLRYISRS